MIRLLSVATAILAIAFTTFACGSAETTSDSAEQALAEAVVGDERRAQRSGQRTVSEDQGPQRVAAEGEVIFPDPVIEETVRKTLKQEEGPILISDVEKFTSFSVALELYVSDLSGLEHMANLTEFDVTQNTVSDLTPLAGLTNLNRLDLAQNDISDITSLAALTNLTFLRLKDNRVSDISTIANFTELTELDLWENEISDLTALTGLTKLTKLNLVSNNISDLSPLAALSNLKRIELSKNQITDISPLLDANLPEGAEVRLWGEPLSQHSIDEVIPQLEAAGVKIEF